MADTMTEAATLYSSDARCLIIVYNVKNGKFGGSRLRLTRMTKVNYDAQYEKNHFDSHSLIYFVMLQCCLSKSVEL